MDSFISKEVSESYPFVIDQSPKSDNSKVEATLLMDFSIRNSDPIIKTPSDTDSIRVSDTSKTMFCDICGKCFSSKKSYLSHVYQTHPDRSTLDKHPCPKCKKIFHYQFQLNKHVKISHSKNSFICQECNNPYQSLKALRLHQRKKHV